MVSWIHYLFILKRIHFYFLTERVFGLVRYLDTAGMKRSRAYLVNGVIMFFAWLVSYRLIVFSEELYDF